MKKLLLLFCLGFSALIYSQNLNGRFSSSIYSFERFQNSETSATHVRSFQMLNLNFNYDNISVRSFFNLEHDFAKEMTYDPRLRFYNLYFEARKVFDIATFKLGRQPIIYSVGGGLFDGASVTLSQKYFRLNAFYGGNVPAYQKFELTKDWKNNYILGGKISTHGLEDFQFGFGYFNKNYKPEAFWTTRLTPELDPIQVLIENNSNQYEFLTGEASYSKDNLVSVNARYDYDLNFSKTSKFDANLRYEQVENLGISLYYNFREPLVRYNSIFAVFDYGNTQEIEVGADYKFSNEFTVIGKYANVSYKDDNSSRLGVGLATSWGNINYRKTFGYAGEQDAISLYTAYTFLDGLITPSIGLGYTSYKLSKDDPTNNLTSLLGGFNIRPWRQLSFDLQGQYINNKIYNNDVRFFFKLNYWFNLNI